MAMDVKFTEAVSAMNKAAELGGQGMEPRETSEPGAFAQMVKNVAQEVVDTSKQGEKLAAEAVAGNVALADVATAVSNAEITGLSSRESDRRCCFCLASVRPTWHRGFGFCLRCC